MDWVKKQWWVAGLLLALLVALLSPLASPHPDGLERVAEDEQFVDRAQDAPYEVLPDYTVPGVTDAKASTILAGLVGTVLVFGVAYGLSWALRRRSGGAAS